MGRSSKNLIPNPLSFERTGNFTNESCMSRRDFVRLGLATLIATGAGKLRPAFAQTLATGQGPGSLAHPMLASEPKGTAFRADFRERIAPMFLQLAPQVA